ncbi:37409_t:CDS:2, partial [Gigaspora margarita]
SLESKYKFQQNGVSSSSAKLEKILFMGEQIDDNNQINCTSIILQSCKQKQYDKAIVFNIFDQLSNLNKDKIQEWVDYYRTPYIISSLNYHCSKIDHVTWTQARNNTNAAEAAYAYANFTQHDNREIKRKAATITHKSAVTVQLDIQKKEAEVEALELANKK